MHKQQNETTPKTMSFSIDELNEALFDFETLMERCASPFLLLKETARSVRKDSQLQGDKVYVGVKRSQVTPEFLSTINTYLIDKNDTYQETPKGFNYQFKGVPVEVTIIERSYGFTNNPESVYYWGENYLVPNPLEKYLKAQFIVR